MRRVGLTAAELDGVVELLRAAPGRVQAEFILTQPRQALRQARHEGGWPQDPRLSRAGNRLARRLSQLLEGLTRMETWLRTTSHAELSPADRGLLEPTLARLAQAAQGVVLVTEDLLGELRHERAHASGDRPSLAGRGLDPADGP
jgi:hypothetical protein